MDKSPLKTLTLEDFLESERHKLTGTLTPVTPESFAKWKKERLDKKAAEDEARQAKEATGRAMFEKGGWEESGDEGEESGDEEGGEEVETWNMEEMRRETERLKEQKERERIEGGGGEAGEGPSTTNGYDDHNNDHDDNDDENEDEDQNHVRSPSDGTQEKGKAIVMTNGINMNEHSGS